MSNAVADRRHVLEIAAGSLALADGRVDEQNHVIRRVKILGFHSRNLGRTIGLEYNEFGDAINRPYSYSAEAMQAAIPLYEGVSVFSGHVKFGYEEETGRRIVTDGERDNDDLVGWIQGVTLEGDGSKETDGLYGDFHYLSEHPFNARVVEIAKRRPDKLSFSHEAYFDDPRVVDGRIVLSKIRRVDSVALVSDKPGTTRGLFETAAPDASITPNGVPKMSASASTKTTIKKLLETVAKDTKGHKRLLEMTDQYGAEMADVPVEVAAASSPEDQIKAGIVAAIVSKVESATPEQLEAVLEALGMGDSLSAAATGKSGKAAEEEAPTEEEKKEPPVAESKKPDRGGVILECVGILRECGVGEYHETVLEAMANLPTKEKRLAFARSQKPAGEIKPRSQAPQTPVLETAAKANSVDYGKDPDQAARALRGVS